MANWIKWLGAILPTRVAVHGPTDDFWYHPVGQTSFAGINVKPETAMAVAAVYGCIRVLRESLGSLPLKVYHRIDEKTTELARKHDVWNLLQKRPNGWMTPQEWKEMGVLHVCLRGNFYCRILGSGPVTQLMPLSPDRVSVEQLDSSRIVYTYRVPGKDPEPIAQDDMLHVRGMTLNGVLGVSVLEYARNAVGSAIAMEKHGATLYGKGAMPPFWISRPAERRWTKDAIANFRRLWRKIHAGPENAANPPILQDDMLLHALTINHRDLQFIEGQNLSAENICGFFGVHPALVFKSKETAGNNEQISQQFKTYTLGPLGTRFEQAVDRDLLGPNLLVPEYADTPPDDAEYFARFTYDGLTRATMKDRYEAHNIAVQGGWKLVNEVRATEDMNPIDGGDEPRFPLNMQPAGGGPDRNEQGGPPGKGQPKEPEGPSPDIPSAPPSRRRRNGRSTKAAFRILLGAAAVRIASKEIRNLGLRADRAAEDRDMFNEWAQQMYLGEVADYVVKTIDPVCAAWLAQTKKRRSPEEIVEALQHCISPVFDATVDVPTLLETWKITRADELTDTLERIFFNGKV